MIRSDLAEQAVVEGRAFRASVTDPSGEGRIARPRAKEADQARRDNDQRKWDREEEDRHERRRRERLQRSALQCAPANPDQGFDHDRQHGGLQTEERARDNADFAPFRVDDAERHQSDDAGQDEQPAGHDATARAVHQPADIGRELLGLGTGQQHAIVERMQEAALGHPLFFFDENAVHHRDLTGRAAEA